MPESISVNVDGKAVQVTAETTVAAAVFIAGADFARISVSGEPRAPLCGMGICFECRVTINGQAHLRGCQILCRAGMEIKTR